MFDNKTLWDSVLSEIENSVSRATFTTWFKDTGIIRQEEGVIFLSVPNQFVKEWLFNKYHKTILKKLRDVAEYVRNIEYVVTKEVAKNESVIRKVENPTAELPLANYYINKEDNLNPRYVFDSFVVGSFNDLAYAAAQAVIKKPGIAYNPLFVYGNTGHGKTHLIQAVGNYMKGPTQNKKVYYMTSENYYLGFVNAMQENKITVFKEKYRKYDVFIMDDVQFLSNKEKTQEELFHLFNTLYDNNKQIIFSSDKHINYIPNLEDRLKSRFAAGMIVDIQPPDYDSRVAIIKTKCLFQDLLLPDDVIEFLAASENNIRELEGALNTIAHQTNIKNKALSLLEIKNIIKETSKPKRMVSIKEIIKTVADFYDIPETSIYEKTRRKEVVKPRQIIMYILREDFKVSYPTIGDKLGGRDHTTVIHSCEKIRREIKESLQLNEEIERIKTLLK
ncbi:MAG: chromosomal replication initiator protein DnaA [bacterium]|nr:chromosomal replication initiator protein DnaA [bacterium]